MDIHKNELSHEDLAKVNGGYGNLGFDKESKYSPVFPHYLILDVYDCYAYCAGFKAKENTTMARCEACQYAENGLCTLRTWDNDPYA